MAKIIPSDSEIQRNVLDELDWDPEVEAPDVGVEVDDGVVTLNGHVANHAIKVAAERAAQRVHGVRAVASDIVVRAPGADGRTDTDIALAIADRFEWSDVIPHEQLRITVEDGVVTLGGSVGWRYESLEAEQLVRTIHGVVDVVNDIAVVPPQVTDEAEIAGEIERAFRRHAELDAQNIEVQIVGSVVVLRGTVSSWSEREEAESVAWRSPGTKHVENEIRIEP
ncbi:MAG: BON domain-containing protein [Thermomicrobiales bacterium]